MATTRLRGYGLAACGVAACAGTWLSMQSLYPSNARRAAADTTPLLRPQQTTVAARGRLQPAGGVLRIAGPNRPGAVISTLSVREGDWVAAGHIVAVLEGTAAQQATVQRLAAEARHAATELQRFERLHRNGIVSTAERESAQLQADVARAELARAQAELDASRVRAPVAGRVLTIHTHAGERIGTEGVLELGNTAEMEVVAEVYETDIARVRVGQSATVSAAALAEPLAGTVERIGITIGKQSIFDIDPAADTDARVIEVHIRLPEAGRVGALTNLQVDVDFEA